MTTTTALRTIYADRLSAAAREEIRLESASWPESDGVAACADVALESGLRFSGQHNVLDALTSGATTLAKAHAAYGALSAALADVALYDTKTWTPTPAAREAVWATIKAHGVCAVEVGLHVVPGPLDTGATLDLLAECGVKHPSERR